MKKMNEMNEMNTSKIEKARALLELCERSGIKVIVRPVLRPADKVTPELEKAARELVDELLQLVLAEQGGGDPILCTRCNRVLNSSPVEEVAKVRPTLLMPGSSAAWPPEAVDRLEARLRPGDRIVRIDPPGYNVVVERADGSVFTIGRCDA
jgi:hypothetical protein